MKLKIKTIVHGNSFFGTDGVHAGDTLDVDILKDDADGLIHASTYVNLKIDHDKLMARNAFLVATVDELEKMNDELQHQLQKRNDFIKQNL